MGAALRIASIEAEPPRLLVDIADVVDEDGNAIRKKFHRLIRETDLSAVIAPSDLVVDPPDYIPYMARQLDVDEN